MRGALELDGIDSVDVEPGRKEFSVAYNERIVTSATILAALEKAGEKATIVGK